MIHAGVHMLNVLSISLFYFPLHLVYYIFVDILSTKFLPENILDINSFHVTSCRAASVDLPDPLLPSFFIVHRSQ